MVQTLFTPDDVSYMATAGHSIETVLKHIDMFHKGMSFARLDRPCTVDDGITRLSPDTLAGLERLYAEAAQAGRITKFVPASGAATRMFQALLTFREQQALAAPSREVEHFLANLRQFAFYDDLRQTLRQQALDLEELLARSHYTPVLISLLTPHGLNYAGLPKALLRFHRYADHCRTPFEEHLVEAAAYAADRHNRARLHMTVSAEHLAALQAHSEQVRPRYEAAGVRYDLTFSLQHPCTNTLAVDLENRPLRDAHNRLLFRPGGHGALLRNLQDLQGDIVFIKNIDNVLPDRLKDTTYRYKRALGGYLVQLQRQIGRYLEQLTAGTTDMALVQEISTFARQQLSIMLPEDLHRQPLTARCAFLKQRLHRPVRVCGMVRNVGEPGGGPFWVQQEDGTLALQIVEASQVDSNSAPQQAILRSATHFNPVDLVCGLRDYQGHPFHLEHFADPNAGFISHKTHAGKPLKALELPGLWNGAMAYWNTVFVEVPGETFSPVKTVLDLLRPEHQA
ncbi:MAG: DUF4301 family protein [Candidatus Tectimicrobiota bacterium]